MHCSVCGTDTTSSTGICGACASGREMTGERHPTSTPWGDSDDGETRLGAPATAVTFRHAGSAGVGPLTPGQAFGRYHIIRLLGAGGMGAVYQAWDDELGESVAVKVIRPQIEQDPAAARDIERRFKRELLLARQVTHKNVVRIHDLGEIGGIKYITMPYVQGRDLATVLRHEGRLPIASALTLARDVVSGLQAAHEAGVVHRDLKPANIMVDDDGRAVIMDFGIARSTSGAASGTMAGAVIGTLEYMAPEQALGQVVDHRADHYAFGLILHDMLVGPRQASRAESAVAELLHRIQQPLPPVRGVDATIPEAVDALIARCTAPDPVHRFATTAELVASVEALTGPRGTGVSSTVAVATPASATTRRQAPAPGRTTYWRPGLLAAAAALVMVAGILVVVRPWATEISEPSGAESATVRTSVAVVPFRNAGGDATMDWLGASIAEVLRREVGQAGAVRVVPGSRTHEILRDLRVNPGSASWDGGTARRVAEFGNAEMLVTGEYARFGAQVRIDAVVRDMRRAVSTPVSATAADENAILAAVGELARGLHPMLSADVPAAQVAPPLQPSSTSMAALRAFSEGLEAAQQGDHQQALQRFQDATGHDAQFALAWARLAQAHADLGYDAQAAEASRRAVALSDALPERERYVIAAMHAGFLNDHQNAIEAYERLLAAGADAEVTFALAGRYEAVGAFDKARERYAQVVDEDPNYLDALFALGRVEILRKSPQAALEPLNRALSVAIQIENKQMEGTLLNAIGVAYKRLDKPAEALRYYRDSLGIREALGDKRGMAATQSELAQVEALLGRPDEALQHYRRSLALRKDIGDRRGVGNTLNDIGSLHESTGQLTQALDYYTESLQVQQEVGNEDYQALCLHNIANIFSAQARYEDAVSYYTRALQIREKLGMRTEVAEIHYNVGTIRLRQGTYEESLRHFLAAVRLSRELGDRRAEAVAVAGTSAVFARQGRYGAAVEAGSEALATWRTGTERGPWHAGLLAAHGYALGLSGRSDEARAAFGEAMAAAREGGDTRVLSEVLVAHTSVLLMAGDLTAAAAAAAEALDHATRQKDARLTLAARLVGAEVALRSGRAASTIQTFTVTRDGAARLGLAPLAADARAALGEALLATRAFPRARAELDAALQQAERIGARGLAARVHYALALTARAMGREDSAAVHAGEARRALDQLRLDTPGDTLLTRVDMQPLAAPMNVTERVGHR